jgi:hypothetical protein
LALHEIVHEIKSKRQNAVILKLDFEKAYDRVNWAFLREVLVRKGFESGFIHRIMQLVSGGQTAICINGEVGPYFRNKRGVRQGDPISPLLFDFIADALAAILDAAARAGHIRFPTLSRVELPISNTQTIRFFCSRMNQTAL